MPLNGAGVDFFFTSSERDRSPPCAACSNAIMDFIEFRSQEVDVVGYLEYQSIGPNFRLADDSVD